MEPQTKTPEKAEIQTFQALHSELSSRERAWRADHPDTTDKFLGAANEVTIGGREYGLFVRATGERPEDRRVVVDIRTTGNFDSVGYESYSKTPEDELLVASVDGTVNMANILASQGEDAARGPRNSGGSETPGKTEMTYVAKLASSQNTGTQAPGSAGYKIEKTN